MTSGLLSFATLFLLLNASAYHSAQQVVDEVVGRSCVEVKHLKRLKYLNAVLRETLRLSPTVPAFARRSKNGEDITLGGGRYEVTANETIMGLLGTVHRDHTVYGDDVNDFRPERMLDVEFDMLPKAAWKVSTLIFHARCAANFGVAHWDRCTCLHWTHFCMARVLDGAGDDSSEFQSEVRRSKLSNAYQANAIIKPKDFVMKTHGMTAADFERFLYTPAGSNSGLDDE